jgi:hypothetical protein
MMRYVFAMVICAMALHGEPVYDKDGWGVVLRDGCTMRSEDCALSVDTKYGWCDVRYSYLYKYNFSEVGGSGSCRIEYNGATTYIQHATSTDDRIEARDLLRLMEMAISQNQNER